MLELKFVMFIDFPRNMKSGVFISCADDIELFESTGNSFLFFFPLSTTGVTNIATARHHTIYTYIPFYIYIYV
jgi:fucose-1-phosphate guanylyltransferase